MVRGTNFAGRWGQNMITASKIINCQEKSRRIVKATLKVQVELPFPVRAY